MLFSFNEQVWILGILYSLHERPIKSSNIIHMLSEELLCSEVN